jgi:multiple sugar transport system ATP-binding protein
MAAIEIRDVAKRFGSFNALVDIDLDVADREFLVLLGASGCGKTTLLRLIAGLDTPTQGELRIGGKRVNELPPRSRGIAMVFQNYAVFPHLTVFENIAFGLRMKRLPDSEIDTKVKRSAELLHIEQLLTRYSGQLSGGQRQRVAVARALAMGPEVLLMDEPLSNLDALLRMEMRAELKGVVQETRTTTIYVTHDQVEAMSLGDRIAVMHTGRIVQAAAPIDVYRHPANQFVGGFIGSPPMNFLPARRHNGAWRVADVDLAGPASERGEIVFGIRPEDLSAADSGLTGTVRVVEPLGAHQLVTMTVADAIFRAVLDSDLAVKSGDSLTLQPRPERVRWFDAESGAALPSSAPGPATK